ncbi:MAG: hypothetical protein ACYC8S_02470 [Minisyncoccota bacterium]
MQKRNFDGVEKVGAFRKNIAGEYALPFPNGEKHPQIRVRVRHSKRKGDNRMYLDVLDIEKGHPLFRAWNEVTCSGTSEEPEGEILWINFPPSSGHLPERIPRAKRYLLQGIQQYVRAVYVGKSVDGWTELLSPSDKFSRRDMSNRRENVRRPPQLQRVATR